MPRMQSDTRAFAWVGLLLCGLALLAATAVAVASAQVLGRPEVDLSAGEQQVVLPPDKAYGIYIDDADNSGYSVGCQAVDAGGRQVQMEEPGASVSSSDTEMLDFVFNTGSGRLTITCSFSGVEGVRAGPVLSWTAILLSALFIAVVGIGGTIMVILWVVARKSSPTISDPRYIPAATAVAAAGGHDAPQHHPALEARPAEQRAPNLLPAILATAIGGPLAGLETLRWLFHVFLVPDLWDDPDLWPGGRPPDGGPSTSDMVRSTWTEMVPVFAVVALVVATLLLCARRARRAAWISAMAAIVLGVLIVLPF